MKTVNLFFQISWILRIWRRMKNGARFAMAKMVVWKVNFVRFWKIAMVEEYKVYCDILNLYDSTVFATIGDNKTLSDYTFDSLTRIQYDGGYTTLSQEASLIIKSSIVLNQSGLIDVISSGIDTIPMPLLMKNEFKRISSNS